MRKIVVLKMLVLIGALFALTRAEAAAAPWIEGTHYFLVQPMQSTDVPAGKVEVVEVFSYGCPACYAFYPYVDQLKAALPPQAQLSYLPASWHPEEDWVVFQRAFLAAQTLGLVERTHDAMFDAIWKTGELATIDKRTERPKSPLPSINDVAKFYNRVTKVKQEDFLATANSFGVESGMKRADAKIKAYRADQTPTIIVNGKYRVTPNSAGGAQQLIDLVKWLVVKESK